MRQSRICFDWMMFVVVTMPAIAASESSNANARAKTWAATPPSVPNSVPRHVLICLIHMIKGGAMKVSSHAMRAASIIVVRGPATHTMTVGTIIVAAVVMRCSVLLAGAPVVFGRSEAWVKESTELACRHTRVIESRLSRATLGSTRPRHER